MINKNDKNQTNKTNLQNTLAKSLALGCTVVALSFLWQETAFAAFDLDKAGKALTDPITKFIDSYWPVGVLALGTGGAVVAQGDLKVKALGFGAGTLLAGLVMGGVKMGLGV